MHALDLMREVSNAVLREDAAHRRTDARVADWRADRVRQIAAGTL